MNRAPGASLLHIRGMDLQLRERVFLVTGGSDGLGAATVLKLSGEGARVAFCARGEARLHELASKCSGEVMPFQADVRSAQDCERFATAALQRFGRIDGLINNAGASAARPFSSVSDADWQADLDLKLMASIRMTRLCLPSLERNGGAILFVLAIAAKAPGAQSEPSSVSRAAGLALSKALAQELGPRQIRVNSILIGRVESGQWRRHAEAKGEELAHFYEREARETRIPLGRYGRADELADLVAFLMSSRAEYITGTAARLRRSPASRRCSESARGCRRSRCC